VSFFGRMQLVMPDPLVVEKFQRPFPVPNWNHRNQRTHKQMIKILY
jgi:hypothetical protein